jgi:tryptophanyl-tRNA synthetase
LKEPTELQKILKVGADKASAVAEETLKKTYDAMGFIPRA